MTQYCCKKATFGQGMSKFRVFLIEFINIINEFLDYYPIEFWNYLDLFFSEI